MVAGCVMAGFMPSNRSSLENNSSTTAMPSANAAIGGGFSPNHSSTAAAGGGGSTAAINNVGLMHTFLQPASPMDTSVYKE